MENTTHIALLLHEGEEYASATGKGATEEEAKEAAIQEACEWYEWPTPEEAREAVLADIDSGALVWAIGAF